MPDKPVRIYGVSDVAAAWGVSPERVRQIIRDRALKPQLIHMTRANYITCYWFDIPARNGIEDLMRELMEEDD